MHHGAPLFRLRRNTLRRAAIAYAALILLILSEFALVTTG